MIFYLEKTELISPTSTSLIESMASNEVYPREGVKHVNVAENRRGSRRPYRTRACRAHRLPHSVRQPRGQLRSGVHLRPAVRQARSPQGQGLHHHSTDRGGSAHCGPASHAGVPQRQQSCVELQAREVQPRRPRELPLAPWPEQLPLE